VRIIAASILASALGGAPLQCAKEPEHQNREYETPAEALYGLAQTFAKRGDDKAWRETLEYLVERYPNDRYAKDAKKDLAAAGAE